MSRVGKKPIAIPDGVKVTIHPDRIEFEGKLGKLASPLYSGIQASLDGGKLVFIRANDSPSLKSLHGLCRSLAQNAMTGVKEGFQRKLEIVGVGYKAKIEKNKLEMSLGYSKPMIYEIPEGIEIAVDKSVFLTIKGIDCQKVGQVAREIRNFRPPDPYKLKGIRYAGEKLLKKERKAGVSGA